MASVRDDAMKPRRPGPTRTAAPRAPARFPWGYGYRSYVAFGSCGIFLLLSGLLVLRAVWNLGSGETAWNELLADFARPSYLVYHALALVGIVWFTLRFFRLFPKTQPTRIGPARKPPDVVFVAGLTGAFVLSTALLAAVLWGVLA